MSFWEYNLKKVFFFFLITLFFSCSQKKSENSENIENKERLYNFDEYDFYIAEDEKADWVEELVKKTNEEIALNESQSILEMQEIIDANRSSTFSDDENQITQIYFTDENKKLKLSKYDNEVFLPQEKDNYLIFVNKNDKYITRDFYNKNYILEKTQVWKNDEKGELVLQSTYEYFYKANKVVKKIVTSNQNVTEYNYAYDEKNRLIFENEIEKSKNNSKKKIYEYNKEDELSNYEYFENEKLIEKTVYSSKTQYTTQVFLEDNFSVKTFYVDGKKRKEEYILDGIVVRERNYEK